MSREFFTVGGVVIAYNQFRFTKSSVPGEQ
jgi:hypothetical protein